MENARGYPVGRDKGGGNIAVLLPFVFGNQMNGAAVEIPGARFGDSNLDYVIPVLRDVLQNRGGGDQRYLIFGGGAAENHCDSQFGHGVSHSYCDGIEFSFPDNLYVIQGKTKPGAEFYAAEPFVYSSILEVRAQQ